MRRSSESRRQEGSDEAMRQAFAASGAKEACAASNARGVPAASSTMAASAASDADMAEKNQIGEEKPVLLISSPVCCITMIKSQNVVGKTCKMSRRTGCDHDDDAGCKQSEQSQVQNFVQQCARHLEEQEICPVPGNAGRLFLHQNLWDRWSRGLSFAMKMSDGPDVGETQRELCRYHLAMSSPRRGSCFESKSEYVTEELSMCCCNKDERTKTHVNNVMLMFSRGPRREGDGVELCELFRLHRQREYD